MRPSTALAIHRDSILKAAGRYRVRKILVFGSAARGDDTEGSDLDLLVDMPADTTLLDMVGLQDDLCTALGIHVDVVTANDLPDRVRTRVLREARPL